MEERTRELTAVERAREYGIDISLLESSLQLTPTERLIRAQDLLALGEAFRGRGKGPVLRIQALIQRLLDAEVHFVIIDGIAGFAHGSTRVTVDLDICYSRQRDSVGKLVAALAPLKPCLRGAPAGLPFKWDAQTLLSGLNFTLDTDLGPLDLLGEVAGIGQYDAVSKASQTVVLFERPCHILTLHALIRSKLAAGRPQDLEDVKELEALRDIPKKGPEA